MPVWHVSISLWTPEGSKLASPGRLERTAVALLRPVGGDTEWWLWNRVSRIGHLRVAVTEDEHQQIPPGCVIADAGETGPQRRRTR